MWRCNERQGAASFQVCSEFILGNSCRNSWASALHGFTFHCRDGHVSMPYRDLKPGSLAKFGKKRSPLRTQEPSAFWNISIVGQAWQEFRSSWTRTQTHTDTNSRVLRMWPQLTLPTRLLHTGQISPPRGVGFSVFFVFMKTLEYIQICLLGFKCFLNCLFLAHSFWHSHITLYSCKWIQLHFPLPQDCAQE